MRFFQFILSFLFVVIASFYWFSLVPRFPGTNVVFIVILFAGRVLFVSWADIETKRMSEPKIYGEGMFSDPFSLEKKRTIKQAIGFFIVFFIIILVLTSLLNPLLLRIFPYDYTGVKSALSAGANMASNIFPILCISLSFYILTMKKRLDNLRLLVIAASPSVVWFLPFEYGELEACVAITSYLTTADQHSDSSKN